MHSGNSVSVPLLPKKQQRLLPLESEYKIKAGPGSLARVCSELEVKSSIDLTLTAKLERECQMHVKVRD